MFLLFAAAAASIQAPPSWAHRPVAPRVQARATVRIVAGAPLHLGRHNAIEGQSLRVTEISTAGGVQRASLVEFE